MPGGDGGGGGDYKGMDFQGSAVRRIRGFSSSFPPLSACNS